MSGDCSPSTGGARRGQVPVQRYSIAMIVSTILVVMLGIMLHPEGTSAATVLQANPVPKVTSRQSSEAAVTPNSGLRATSSVARALALNSGNSSVSRPHKSSDNYWARFGHSKPSGGRNKTIALAIKDKLTTGKDAPEPSGKPLSECQKISSAGPIDEVNPEVDNLILENVLDEIKVHLAVNDSVVTDPANIRPRIYRRKAATSLLHELRKEAGFRTEEDEENLSDLPIVKSSVVSSPKMLNVTVNEGARVRLVCNVTGVPDYWVEWRRWSNLTFPGGEEVVGGRSVLFDQVGREDAGKYHCTARTADGLMHSVSLMLHVKFMPEVFIWARGGGAEGEVELGCLSQGYPQPQLAWYINNTKIANSVCPHGLQVSVGRRFLAPEWTLSLLRLQGLSSHAHGFYHCTATNSEARAQAVVMVHQGDMSLQPVRERSMVRSLNQLKEEMKDRVKNQMSVFVMGMVPPMYIAFYIIVYLSCYKSQSIVGAAIGRNGGDTSDKYSAGYPLE